MRLWGLFWRLTALAAGLLCVGCEVWGTYDFLIADQGRLNYIVAGGCVVTAGSGLLPIMADREFSQGRWAAALLMWLALPLALIVIFTASIQRTGGTADKAQTQRQLNTRAAEQAKAALDDLLEARKRKEQAVRAECAMYRTAGCKRAEAELDEIGARITAARAAFAQAPTAEQHDAMAERVSAIMRGYATPEQVRLYQPIMLPIVLSIFGAIFLMVGSRAEKHFPTPEAPKIEQSVHLESIAPRPAQVVQMPARSPKPAAVASFLVEKVEPAKGESVSIRELISAYIVWAASRRLPPLAPERFLEEFAQLAKKANIRVAGEGEAVRCQDIKLSA